MLKTFFSAALTASLPVLFITPLPALAADDALPSDEISEITVNAKRVANSRPAGSYASPATLLRFDPLTELQSRGLAEGQSDVTVRGGVFENTGFKLGAVTVMDPQTGHYVAELAVDPAFLSVPAIYKGIDNAVEGFNSAIATVSYAYRPIERGGSVALGGGSDSLGFQSLRFAEVLHESRAGETTLALSAARSRGDGTVAFGDHEFARYNLQLQHRTTAAQSDLVIAYQDKFYGWPGAYTGFASLPEIDDTQTTLLGINHRRVNDSGWWELGAFYRGLEDDYDFDRRNDETGTPGSFEHETKVAGVGLQGRHETGRVSWRYGAQFTSDELVSSTDLTNGQFTERDYLTLTLVPSIVFGLENGRSLELRSGVTLDYSDRDGSKVLPMAGLSWQMPSAAGYTEFRIEYVATSQLPGYTALNSNPTGLFGGNPLLGREQAKQLSLSMSRETDAWQGRATFFSRSDDNLVDWTYSTGTPFSRQANAVDIDVVGFEAFVARQWDSVDLAAGYTWLDKDADYGNAQVDASFYALNFARHRMTLALIYRFADRFELRLDNEYRSQEDNPLRAGDDSTYLAAASLVWSAAGRRGFSVALVADNLTDSEFQPFPGTPAAGRQFSVSATYTW
ncbi:MAG: TonB-dependent receptor [Gammaproteobacteria bacterium]|nr:TonB-dependent receptor [Gammaproteobacteria bacterium]